MKWTIHNRNGVLLGTADTDDEMRALLRSLSNETRAPEQRADHAVSDERYVFASDEMFRRALNEVA